ncbi:MAG: DNA internalization-related competence protein ComEC/Rec2 [Gammaproteobacteria bacterium]|nr:DNA internalization-related competence protein ComEC/Rec2 [Gammaproteobacteria bacterium]
MRNGTLAFLAGIVAVQLLPQLPDVRWAWWLFPIVIIVCLPWSRRLRIPLLIGGGFLYALWRADLILSNRLPEALSGQDLQVTGVIADLPDRSRERVSFTLRVEKIMTDGRPISGPQRLRISWYPRTGYLPAVHAAQRWQLSVRVKTPHGMMNPGGFDYEGYLFRARIDATGYVRDGAGEVNRHLGVATDPRSRLQQFRDQLSQRIAGQLQGRACAGIVRALVVGDTGAITYTQWQVFRDTGTVHLIAISGMHVTLIAGAAYVLMRWLWRLTGRWCLRWPAPQVAALAGMLVAVIYAALAGFTIPTQRALVMTTVLMLAVWRRCTVLPGHTLSVALMLVLLLDPLAVLAGGFWLSFVAVAVICYAMMYRISDRGLWWRWGRLHLLMMIGLMPALLLLFQQLPWLSPLANFIAIPWIDVLVVPAALLGGLLSGVFPFLSKILLLFSNLMLEGLWPLLHALADVRGGQWWQHHPPLWSLLPALIGVALLLAPRGWPGRWLGVIWLLPLVTYTAPRPAPGAVWFSLLDVGQGLAAVIQTSQHTLVYDTGPRLGETLDSGRTVLLPYLRDHGVGRVDVLMIGHSDLDHRGGAESLYQGIPVRDVLGSEPGRLPAMLHSRRCQAGQRWSWDQVELAVIHPQPGSFFTGNNGSCVLQVTARGGRVLLAGDIEAPAERQLLAGMGTALRADILVAPHHGSRTSSTPEFIDQVQPRYVLFAAGYLNRFHLPRDDIVDRYRRHQAMLLSSGLHGAVMFHIDDQGIAPPGLYRQQGRRYWHRPPGRF